MIKKKLVLGLLIGAVFLFGGVSALAYQEAPILRVKVAAGELPPVEERLPDEPKVVKVWDEIGQYGGTFNAFAINSESWNDLTEGTAGSAFLLHMNRDGSIVPDLAKGYELSDDAKSFTLYLRKGLKWSDGYPFTADDILFMFEDMHWNDQVVTWDNYSGVSRIKKIDDYTVRFEMDEPFPVISLIMVGYLGGEEGSYAPKHYLKKWHINYNPDANELAKEEGFDNWWEAFDYHQTFFVLNDIDQPTLMPWMPTAVTSSVKVFERNPYYYQVDEAGNQLPYVDKIVVSTVEQETYHLKIMSGEADIATISTSIQNYPLYRESEEEGEYRVIAVPGVIASAEGIGVNQNISDPFLRGTFQDVRFRQALSIAIDREEINDTVYFGLGVPRQATTVPSASYWKEEWGEAYIEYDPGMASDLLDEMGLTERDKDGFRINPDGEPILLILEFAQAYHLDVTVFELIKEYWEDVGLKVLIKGLPSGGILSDEHMVWVHPYATTGEVALLIEPFRPGPGGLRECPEWEAWLGANDDVSAGRKKLDDFEGGKLPGEEPPAKVKQQWDRVRTQVGRTLIGSKEYMEVCEAIYDYQAENLYHIGVVGLIPQLYIVKKDIGNFPETFGPDADHQLELMYDAQQFFWKQ